MREGESYVEPFALGKPMEGGCVGKVIQSNRDGFAEGDYVLGDKGWRDCWVSDGEGVVKVDPDAALVQQYLGVLGMTGMTAYVGLMKIGQLQQGERVFVSAASGAVGSIACQIAKIKKCRVVGSAGSAEKLQWLKRKAGIDEAFNYHDTDDVSAKLAELMPDGIDVYFDNVGGDHLEGAIDNMRDFGRIVACGMISAYNDETPQPGPRNLFKIIAKRLRVQGFIVRDHFDMRAEFVRDMEQWIQANEIVWEETVTEGLENAPQAFINLFHGDKMGKALVKL
jgi:NADPH-dependent curcumin reductase CurA